MGGQGRCEASTSTETKAVENQLYEEEVPCSFKPQSGHSQAYSVISLTDSRIHSNDVDDAEPVRVRVQSLVSDCVDFNVTNKSAVSVYPAQRGSGLVKTTSSMRFMSSTSDATTLRELLTDNMWACFQRHGLKSFEDLSLVLLSELQEILSSCVNDDSECESIERLLSPYLCTQNPWACTRRCYF